MINWNFEFCNGCDNEKKCINPCNIVKGAIMRNGKKLKKRLDKNNEKK